MCPNLGVGDSPFCPDGPCGSVLITGACQPKPGGTADPTPRPTPTPTRPPTPRPTTWPTARPTPRPSSPATAAPTRVREVHTTSSKAASWTSLASTPAFIALACAIVLSIGTASLCVGAYNARKVKWAATVASSCRHGDPTDVQLDPADLYAYEHGGDAGTGLFTELTAVGQAKGRAEDPDMI